MTSAFAGDNPWRPRKIWLKREGVMPASRANARKE